MTPCDDNFISKSPYTGTTKIVARNGAKLVITHVGNCIIRTATKLLKLHFGFHVPHLKCNLISIKRLCQDNNCRVIFDDSTFSIQDKETRMVLLQVGSSGYLYPISTPSPCAFLTLHQPSDVWHHRLGHSSSRTLDL